MLILLITGLVSTSLIQQSLINSKMICNYITNEKLSLTLNSGKRIIDYLKQADKVLTDQLVLSYGKDYNIRINIKDINKHKDYIKYIIKAAFDAQDKEVYYIVQENE